MRVTKGGAFITGITSTLTLAVLALFMLEDPAVISGAIIGIVGCTTAYIAGNVADNGVKGRNYCKELDK